jgi:hypothetical protein
MSERLTLEQRKQNYIIEEDADESLEKSEEEKNKDLTEKSQYYDPLEVEINIQDDPQSIFQYVRMMKAERIKTDPEYQRNLVWKDEQKSRLIESILMNFPLPPFYLNQQKDGKYVIIDGLQRTTTLYDFLENKFSLKGLKVLTTLSGKKFSDLDNALQAKIEEKKITLYILKPSVPMGVIYELFDRINTGGTPLNRQEVRNCIFVGKATDLLKELSQEATFKKAIDNGVTPTRMKDRELILRYLSFKILNMEDYKDNLSDFVEIAMRKINEMEQNDIENIKIDFLRVMRITLIFFGERNFRFPIEDYKGAKSVGFINTALFETVCYFFSTQTNTFLEENKGRIIENFDTLLQDDAFRKASRTSTGSRQNVEIRFTKAQEILSRL